MIPGKSLNLKPRVAYRSHFIGYTLYLFKSNEMNKLTSGIETFPSFQV